MKSGNSRPCARLLAVGLVVAAVLPAAAQKPDDLSDTDWRLLEQWRSAPDPFPELSLKDLYKDTWYRGEAAREIKVAKPVSERALQQPSPQEIALQQLQSEAQAGNARAQFQLGEIYDAGKIVPRDTSLAFNWWHMSARQGFRMAEHNLGIAYLVGIGVTPNREEAIRWLAKAGELGDSIAGQYVQRLRAGLAAAPTQVATGPSGVREEYPEPVSSVIAATPSNSENERILAGIVKEYAKNHTYVGQDIYACVDMANDVWNQVTTRGINAKVMIGNVRADMESPLDANHAWVLAEALPGRWVALEATAGTLVYDNARYYQGHVFSNPKELKEYQALAREYNEAVKKHNSAADEYNQALVAYQNSTWFARSNIEVELFRRQTILNERKADLDQVAAKLLALLNAT